MKKLYKVITAQESENDYQKRVRSLKVIAENVLDAIEKVRPEIEGINKELAKDTTELYGEYVDEVNLISCIDYE